MYSYINCTCHRILLELTKKGRWMAGSCIVRVTWGVCTGFSEIPNPNERSLPLLAAYTYTKLQTWWCSQCCYGSLNSISGTLLHSQCSNIFTVVMLVFCLCQFNTGNLPCELRLSSTVKCFVWLFQFHICSLVYGWWCLLCEFRWVLFIPV